MRGQLYYVIMLTDYEHALYCCRPMQVLHHLAQAHCREGDSHQLRFNPDRWPISWLCSMLYICFYDFIIMASFSTNLLFQLIELIFSIIPLFQAKHWNCVEFTVRPWQRFLTRTFFSANSLILSTFIKLSFPFLSKNAWRSSTLPTTSPARRSSFTGTVLVMDSSTCSWSLNSTRLWML